MTMRIGLEKWIAGFDPNNGIVVEEQQEILGTALRDVRDALLRESDWTQNYDSQLPENVKQEWLTYRQALRDFPSSFDSGLIGTIVDFPEPPVMYRPRNWAHFVDQGGD